MRTEREREIEGRRKDVEDCILLEKQVRGKKERKVREMTKERGRNEKDRGTIGKNFAREKDGEQVRENRGRKRKKQEKVRQRREREYRKE